MSNQDRPDLAQWKRRHELRSSNAAQPIPSGKTYSRKPKHGKKSEWTNMKPQT